MNFKILVCPGIHPPQLTEDFLDLRSQVPALNLNWLIFPTQEYSAYSPIDVLTFLRQQLGNPAQAEPVLFIGFSAGVVGAVGAATLWQLQSGKVIGVIALDGWGVPLAGSAHRLSHDFFTHWSSALLGAGGESFYAEPPVEHLALWRSPHTVWGWWVKSPGCRVRCTAAQFLIALLRRYRVSNC